MPSAFEQLPLQDIHLPDPVSWWPPAWGWWLLLAALLLTPIAVWTARVWLRPRLRTRKLRRAAEREFECIVARHRRVPDDGLLLQDVSMWLRRVAISAHGRAVGGRTGHEWIQWLDAHSKRPVFEASLGQMLTQAPYRGTTKVDPAPLLAACRIWVRHLT